MTFDLRQPQWRIYVIQAGCFDISFNFSGPKRAALKEAANELLARKRRGLRQRGSLYRDRCAVLEHPAFGIDTCVRIERW